MVREMTRIVVEGYTPIFDANGISTCTGWVSVAGDYANLEEAKRAFNLMYPHAKDATICGLRHTRAEWEAITGELASPDYTFADDVEKRLAEDERKTRRKHWPWSLFWPA